MAFGNHCRPDLRHGGWKGFFPQGSCCHQCWCDPCRCWCSACWCDPCCCLPRRCERCGCRPCKCHYKKKKEFVECDRGKRVPKDRDPNIIAKWKSEKKCELGDSAIHEKHSIVTVLRRPSVPGDPGNAAEIRLQAENSAYHVGFKAPVLTLIDGSTVWTLPDTDGSINQRLVTDGSRQLGWDDCCAPDPAVVNDDYVCLRAGELLENNPLNNDFKVIGPTKVVVSPVHGNAQENEPFVTVSYTADRGYTGCDSFAYSATLDDGSGDVAKQKGTVYVDIVSRPPPPVPGDYRFIYSLGFPGAISDDHRRVYEYHDELTRVPIFVPFHDLNEGEPLVANGLATNREDNLIYYCWRMEIENPLPGGGTETVPTIFAFDYVLPDSFPDQKQFIVAYIAGGALGTALNSPFAEVINDNPDADIHLGPEIGADFASVQGSKVLYLAGSKQAGDQGGHRKAQGHYRIVLGHYDGSGEDFSQIVQSVTWVPWLSPPGGGENPSAVMGDLTYNPITGGLVITGDGTIQAPDITEVDPCSGAVISPSKPMTNWQEPGDILSEHQSTWDAFGTQLVTYRRGVIIPSTYVSAVSAGTGFLQGPRKEVIIGLLTQVIDMAQWISQKCDQ